MVKGVLFDKDGTLFDFQRTWGDWAGGALATLARGVPERLASLAQTIQYDMKARRFHPDSLAIAGTNADLADALAEVLWDRDRADILEEVNRLAMDAPLAEAVPLVPLLSTLREAQLKLGVATNDSEAPARAHLTTAGVHNLFDFICGYDSGFGAKPDPGMLVAFADTFGLACSEVVMVGDSRHDLEAGRAAGMQTVAVLTGVASAVELAPLADAVLPDIGHLPDWLAGSGAA